MCLNLDWRLIRTWLFIVISASNTIWHLKTLLIWRVIWRLLLIFFIGEVVVVLNLTSNFTCILDISLDSCRLYHLNWHITWISKLRDSSAWYGCEVLVNIIMQNFSSRWIEMCSWLLLQHIWIPDLILYPLSNIVRLITCQIGCLRYICWISAITYLIFSNQSLLVINTNRMVLNVVLVLVIEALFLPGSSTISVFTKTLHLQIYFILNYW